MISHRGIINSVDMTISMNVFFMSRVLVRGDTRAGRRERLQQGCPRSPYWRPLWDLASGLLVGHPVLPAVVHCALHDADHEPSCLLPAAACRSRSFVYRVITSSVVKGVVHCASRVHDEVVGLCEAAASSDFKMYPDAGAHCIHACLFSLQVLYCRQLLNSMCRSLP